LFSTACAVVAAICATSVVAAAAPSASRLAQVLARQCCGTVSVAPSHSIFAIAHHQKWPMVLGSATFPKRFQAFELAATVAPI
jgi:hypothetical protein